MFQPASTGLEGDTKPVGASLLAKAVGQLRATFLIFSLREQARSHRGLGVRKTVPDRPISKCCETFEISEH